MKLTRLEGLVLNALARDLYQPANGGYPTDYERDTSAVWMWSVSDTARAYMEAKSFPGVVSSLVKKGLVIADGERRVWHRMVQDDYCLTLTESGFGAWRAEFPDKAASDAALKSAA